MECFVPNCKSVIGVSFPTDPILKQTWLESLNLKNLEPESNSFVCLTHFQPTDFCFQTNNSDGISITVKEGALPTFDEQEFTNTSNICRTCSVEGNTVCPISSIVDDVPIKEMLMLCAYPLKINTKDDHLPQNICNQCLATLQSAFKFRNVVLKTNEKFACAEKDTQHTEEDTNSYFTDKPLNSRTANTSSTITLDKSACTKDNKEINKSCNNVIEDLSSIISNVDTQDAQSCIDKEKVVPKILEKHSNLLKKSHINNVVDNTSSSIMLGRQRNKLNIKRTCVEEQGLRKRTVVKEIDINNVTLPKSIKLKKIPSIKIERQKKFFLSTSNVKKDSLLIEEPLKKVQRIEREASSLALDVVQPMQIAKEINVTNMVKSVRMKSKLKCLDAFESSVGKFACKIRHGAFNNIYVEANGYLYVYGLFKQNIKNLQCITPTCKSIAQQNCSEQNYNSNFIEVLTPHNHSTLTEIDKKKEMFYHIMRKSMQTDKTMNIRNIYEKLCSVDAELKELVPLRNVIDELCRYQLTFKLPQITSFEHLYNVFETEEFKQLHFTHSGQQFYQEKFSAGDGSKAIIFCNTAVLQQISDSEIMYVDASFNINTMDTFKYQLVTVLLWLEDSYYPILFVLVSKKTQEILKMVFTYLRDSLAPKLKPSQIITDYEASLYYALGETYLESHIGGSIFYYTQNIYKHVCSLNLCKQLEENTAFRNVYYMLLMLPLLPVNTIVDGFHSIKQQAKETCVEELSKPLLNHVEQQWINNITPELFCVHQLETRINENVVAPFKKFRDFLKATKNKIVQLTILNVISKLIELEGFLNHMYSKQDKKSFGRDLSTSQKKVVLRAWQFIESHPKININSFFNKVIGYVKCMENQLWIWGFYRYEGKVEDNLINASKFSIVSTDVTMDHCYEGSFTQFVQHISQANMNILENIPKETVLQPSGIIVEAVLGENGGVILQNSQETLVVQDDNKTIDNTFLKYVYN